MAGVAEVGAPNIGAAGTEVVGGKDGAWSAPGATGPVYVG
jgi:hypothetical protein